MGSLSIFYNKFYKKVIIFIFLTLTLISFKNDIPYPMLIEFDETVKNDERISNLTNACFVKESMGGSYSLAKILITMKSLMFTLMTVTLGFL